jgi:hypothetical protein
MIDAAPVISEVTFSILPISGRGWARYVALKGKRGFVGSHANARPQLF